MGGFGSGQKWSKKRTVESVDYLDIAALKKAQLVVPGVAGRVGSLQWRSGSAAQASITYVVALGSSAGTLRLVYSVSSPQQDLDYTVRLEATPCHLGGVRWWFRCPLTRGGMACGRRVTKLYRRGSYFGCRHCHDLVYRSSQQSDSRVYALARAGLGALPRPGRASVAQLGLSLKALTLMQKRLRRFT